MKIELNDDAVDQYGRALQFYVDDDGAEYLLAIVQELKDTITIPDFDLQERKDQASPTDQGDVTGR